MKQYLTVCRQAAEAAGKILLEMQGSIESREKARNDLVTEADLKSQHVIRRILLDAFPDHLFIGEEEEEGAQYIAGTDRPCWIVDPLDGTTNYVHGLPSFGVSIALVHEGRVQVGTVFDPVYGECFTAIRGEGSSLNGAKLSVSDCRDLREALIAASLPAQLKRDSQEIQRFIEVMLHCQGIRRLGSAALNLCYLASGRLDAYWATSVQPWDVAAGALVLSEAGGVISSMRGEPFDVFRPQFVAGSTLDLHKQLVELLQRGGAQASS